MAVIKADNAEEANRQAVVLDLGDIARHAEILRQRAQERADRIIAEAEAERERLISDGFESGRSRGYEEGFTQGREVGERKGREEAMVRARQQLDEIERAWNAALDDFANHRHHLLVECKRDVLELAIKIAEAVIHRRVQADERLVLAQIEHALKLVGRSTRVSVAINPADGDLVREMLPTISARLGAIEHVTCDLDPAVEQGGCIVRTAEGGEVDATIQTQIDRIAQTLIPTIERGERELGDRAA
ncbi:MAG TPA: hypothetical protein ENJ00_12160 [Phycisphaerales bacterium]|nr:hypothetical protein [Phycisphaerales bacterium]